MMSWDVEEAEMSIWANEWKKAIHSPKEEDQWTVIVEKAGYLTEAEKEAGCRGRFNSIDWKPSLTKEAGSNGANPHH